MIYQYLRIQKLLLLLEYVIHIELSAWEVSSCRIFVQHMGSSKISLFSSQRILYRRAFWEPLVSHDTHSIMHACHETSDEIIVWKNEAYEMKESLKSSRMFKYVASASRQHRLFKQFENKWVNSCLCFNSLSLLFIVVWQDMKSGMCKLNLHILQSAGSHSGYFHTMIPASSCAGTKTTLGHVGLPFTHANGH